MPGGDPPAVLGHGTRGSGATTRSASSGPAAPAGRGSAAGVVTGLRPPGEAPPPPAVPNPAAATPARAGGWFDEPRPPRRDLGDPRVDPGLRGIASEYGYHENPNRLRFLASTGPARVSTSFSISRVTELRGAATGSG